jgi:hypothetical protein
MNSEVKTYSSRTADKFVVRLPKGMRDRISSVAKNYHRSMNSEIVSRLESSLSLEFNEASPETVDSEQSEMQVSAAERELIMRIRTKPAGKLNAILDLLS